MHDCLRSGSWRVRRPFAATTPAGAEARHQRSSFQGPLVDATGELPLEMCLADVRRQHLRETVGIPGYSRGAPGGRDSAALRGNSRVRQARRATRARWARHRPQGLGAALRIRDRGPRRQRARPPMALLPGAGRQRQCCKLRLDLLEERRTLSATRSKRSCAVLARTRPQPRKRDPAAPGDLRRTRQRSGRARGLAGRRRLAAPSSRPERDEPRGRAALRPAFHRPMAWRTGPWRAGREETETYWSCQAERLRRSLSTIGHCRSRRWTRARCTARRPSGPPQAWEPKAGDASGLRAAAAPGRDRQA